MEPQQTAPSQSNLGIPIAIVLAGGLIALAVFLRGGSIGAGSDVPRPTNQETAEVVIPAPSNDDHILGNPNAPIVLVEYSDFDCPFCQTFHNTMHEIMKTYGKDGKISWIYRQFPLESIHPNAPIKALASECVAAQGGNEAFWKYTDILFANQQTKPADLVKKLAEFAGQSGNSIDTAKVVTCINNAEFGERVQTSYNDAVKAGGRGTPFNILVLKDEISKKSRESLEASLGQYGSDLYTISDDGMRVVLNGAFPLDAMKLVLEALLGN